ncbi:MAG: glycosyltransferase family 2 protein [Marinibacterium sp.]|nr:glycosyltransferase family 2 protein [Marinibacterium sp.]
MLTVTLSTIPARFDKLGPTLNSLLEQTVKPDSIEVYIPHSYRRFPDYDGSLPDLPQGVDVVRADTDYGPATKVLPAARRYAGQDRNLLLVDDDRLYGPRFVEFFMESRQQRPEDVIAGHGFDVPEAGHPAWPDAPQPRVTPLPRHRDLRYRMARIRQCLFDPRAARDFEQRPARKPFAKPGYVDIAEGFCGILSRPAFFSDDMYDIPKGLWSVDDVWLSGHFLKNGHPAWVDCRIMTQQRRTATQTVDALATSVVEGRDRSQANHDCVSYMKSTYGVWS